MSYIPDCRTDEEYHPKNLTKVLTKERLLIVHGFDLATEELENFVANMTMFSGGGNSTRKARILIW